MKKILFALVALFAVAVSVNAESKVYTADVSDVALGPGESYTDGNITITCVDGFVASCQYWDAYIQVSVNNGENIKKVTIMTNDPNPSGKEGFKPMMGGVYSTLTGTLVSGRVSLEDAQLIEVVTE